MVDIHHYCTNYVPSTTVCQQTLHELDSTSKYCLTDTMLSNFKPNYDPWWNSRIRVWPRRIGLSHAGAAAHTSTFGIKSYSSKKGETSQTWPMKYKGVNLVPEQHLLAGLSISKRAMVLVATVVLTAWIDCHASLATTGWLPENTLDTQVRRFVLLQRWINDSVAEISKYESRGLRPADHTSQWPACAQP